jgi:hypothetical protein
LLRRRRHACSAGFVSFPPGRLESPSPCFPSFLRSVLFRLLGSQPKPKARYC